MSILKKLTLKDLKLNKKRTLGTIIGVILSCALILVVGGFFFVMQESLIENEIRNEGYYHVLIDNLTDKQVEELKTNRELSNIVVVDRIGEVFPKKEEPDEHVNSKGILYSYNIKTFNELNYEVLKGEFPKNSNEILIDKEYNHLYHTEAGDVIELEINGVIKSYIVSGISDRYGEFITTGVESSTYKAFLTLKNPSNCVEDINELLGLKDYTNVSESPIYGINYSIRNELLSLETLSFDDSSFKILASLFGVAIFIIMVTSIFAIKNSFAISVSEKTKMYGMLSSVGATKKQIKRMVLFEGFVVGLIGIVLGILLGIFITWFLTFIINSIAINGHLLDDVILIYNFSFLPLVVAILMSVIVIYLSIISGARRASKTSPIQNITNSSDIRSKKIKIPKFINKIFGIGGVISYKNLKRSNKKYHVIMVSLTVSIFIFIAASSLIEYGLKIVNLEFVNLKYNVSVSDTYSKYNLSDYLDELKKLDNSYVLDRGETYYKFLDTSHLNKEIYKESFRFYINLYDDPSFKKIMKDLNLDYEYMKDKVIILNKVKKWYEIDPTFVNATDYKKGDVIELYVPDYPDQSNKHIKHIKLVIGELLTENYPVGLEDAFYDVPLNIVGNREYMDKSLLNDNVTVYYDSEDPYGLSDKIKEINDKLDVNNIEEEASKPRTLIYILSIVAYSFIGVLTLIGVTSVFNTINSNMELRKSEFATLKSVGMTKKEFNRMINLESFFYSFKSLFYGLILGLIGSYVVFLMFKDEYSFSYILPVQAIILSIIFIVVIVLIIMRYSIKKINKYNIIETIRNNNV